MLYAIMPTMMCRVQISTFVLALVAGDTFRIRPSFQIWSNSETRLSIVSWKGCGRDVFAHRAILVQGLIPEAQSPLVLIDGIHNQEINTYTRRRS